MRTPYHSIYERLNAPMFDFGGWQVGSHFSSPDEEYLMMHNGVGFGEYHFQSCFGVFGPDAFNFIQQIIVNDLNKITPGGTLYSSIVDDEANLIDDVIVFWVSEGRFIIHGGITRIAARKWLTEKSEGWKVWISELSNTFLAVQGPKSFNVFQKVVDIADLEPNRLVHMEFEGVPVTIARCGFSGELGYEIHFAPEFAQSMWERFTELCAEFDGGPYGLMTAFPIAIDKGLVFGPDFYPGGSPLEYGLGWSIAFDKGFFRGRDALLRRKEAGLRTKLVGIESEDLESAIKGGLKLSCEGKPAGEITMGGVSPVLKRNLGRAWVYRDFSKAGTELQVESADGLKSVKVQDSYRFLDPKNTRIKVNPRDLL